MLIAGHCVRHPEEEASKLVLWQPKRGKRNKGRQAVTYIDTLIEDTGIDNVEELRTAMMDRKEWRSRAASRRAQARPKGPFNKYVTHRGWGVSTVCVTLYCILLF